MTLLDASPPDRGLRCAVPGRVMRWVIHTIVGWRSPPDRGLRCVGSFPVAGAIYRPTPLPERRLLPRRRPPHLADYRRLRHPPTKDGQNSNQGAMIPPQDIIAPRLFILGKARKFTKIRLALLQKSIFAFFTFFSHIIKHRSIPSQLLNTGQAIRISIEGRL
jgi:hypothetical protein